MKHTNAQLEAIGFAVMGKQMSRKFRVHLKVRQTFTMHFDVEADSEIAVRSALSRLYEGETGDSGLADPATLDELDDLRRDDDTFEMEESHDEIDKIEELT